MAEYSPHENIARIRQGLLALVSGRAIDFSPIHNALIIVFDGPVTRYEGGKILLLQQFIDNHLGIIPRVSRQMPACIKVFFDIEFVDDHQKEELKRLLTSNEFLDLCNELDISQVQFAAQMYYTK